MISYCVGSFENTRERDGSQGAFGFSASSKEDGYMAVRAIVGAQWGDEGKGKIVDFLAAQADVVVRFQGGSNAGHTIVNEYGTFKLHLVPSGIFYPHSTCIIGTGVVVDPKGLIEELNEIKSKGAATGRLLISERAHVVMPYHYLFDKLEEESRGVGKIGTTLRGVGPAYVDKVARVGIQMGDLLDADYLASKVRAAVDQKNKVLLGVYGHERLSADDIIQEYLEYGRILADSITDILPTVDSAIREGRTVLLEGQLGAMRDLDWGIYPYVTSSLPTAGGAASGAGIPPWAITEVIGVVKAYSTSVGEGPMPTELFDEDGVKLREVGGEYGATTGRPRRCGWFDAVAARYGARLSGFTGLAVTKLDVLGAFDRIKVCVAYRDRKTGETYDTVPPTRIVSRVEPVYEELPGWKRPISHARLFDELPAEAQSYVERIEALVGARAVVVSVGPGRDQTILR